jgi:hypothetical protein
MARFVYFVQAPANGKIKIGTTQDPRRRLVDLMKGSPVPLEPLGVVRGGINVERQLHVRFGHCHSHGEWFEGSTDLLAYIEARALPWPEPVRYLADETAAWEADYRRHLADLEQWALAMAHGREHGLAMLAAIKAS